MKAEIDDSDVWFFFARLELAGKVASQPTIDILDMMFLAAKNWRFYYKTR